MFSLSALAVALFVVNAPAFAEKEAAQATHDGKVVSITDSKLVMTGRDGKEHSHSLNADAKVTLDGKAAKASDLKAGTRIRVTTHADDATVATHIEAIDKNETFANTHEGKVVSMSSTRLVMSDKNGKEHSHTLSADAKVTLDGKPCKLGDLKPGMKIRVTTPKSDVGTAIEVEAIEKNAKFA